MRSLWSCMGLFALAACARPPVPACPRVAAVEVPASEARVEVEVELAWLDRASLSRTEPMTLYDVRWLLMAGDSGALSPLPADLHTFTLGRWECALSPEMSDDGLAGGRLTIDRRRRLVCTHGSGMTMQTELACGYELPSPAAMGSPARFTRSTKIALSEGPALTLSCEPLATERLRVLTKGRVGSVEACVAHGAVEPCPSGTD